MKVRFAHAVALQLFISVTTGLAASPHETTDVLVEKFMHQVPSLERAKLVKCELAHADRLCAQNRSLRSSQHAVSMIGMVRAHASTMLRGAELNCSAVYVTAVLKILEQQNLADPLRADLENALPQQSDSVKPNNREIVLRRALGKVLFGQDLALPCIAKAVRGAFLYDFVGGRGIAFSHRVVNDDVMGGESASSFELTQNGAIFYGSVTRANGGGFASVRFDAEDHAALVQRLKTGYGISFAVRHIEGCSAWKFQLLSDGNWFSSVFGQGWVQWQADFFASEDGTPQQITFADLVPTRYGKPLGARGLNAADLGSIVGFGFMLSFLNERGEESVAFYEGAFALNILSVGVY